MKILTTQNLDSLKSTKSTNEIMYYNEFSLFRSNARTVFMENNVSFAAKKPNSKDAKKVVNTVKKVVGDIAKEAKPEVEKGDKLLKSSFFNALLKIADYETVVQAAIAAVICLLLRPVTIMALPTKKSKPKEGEVWTAEQKQEAKNKDKANNIYASAHSIASGIVGLVTVFLLTTPFKNGADYVMNKMMKELKPETLKRLFPHLDLSSIVNKAGERIEPVIEKEVNGQKVKEVLWRNIDGLPFSKDIKNCDMLPALKHLSECSEETFNKILNVNVDWASQKGKSFNEVVTKDGKKLYDVIDFSKLGFNISNIEKSAVTSKEVITNGQVLLKDMDKDFLREMVAKADDNSLFRHLDVESVFDGEKVKDFRLWKNTNGESFILDLDQISASSPLETANWKPRTSGAIRFDKKDGLHKFKIFQGNGREGSLGTEITDEMLSAEKSNEALIKALTWLPDLAFRVPIATGTIALIPWVLKNVFGIEKKKPVNQTEQTKELTPTLNQNVSNKEVAFKAKAPRSSGKGLLTRLSNFISEKMARLYGKPMIESKSMASASEKLGNWSDRITQHMATLGSLITSSVYVQRTLSNKDMDSDRKKTLAINQALCFFVPTAAAYTVDAKINNWVKTKGYRFTGLQKSMIEKAKAEGKDVAEIEKALGQKIKGVRILASLATFTLIYRYLTPVLITPVANWIGDKLNARSKVKKEQTQIA